MSDTPFHNPFGSLSRLRDELPEGKMPEPEPPAARGAGSGPTIARAVVRMERAGRGGKEVTVIEHLGLPRQVLDQWLKALKGALGCGGSVEGDALLLQGDHRKRLPALLTARGVRKIILG